MHWTFQCEPEEVLSLPHYFLSWCFITATEKKLGQFYYGSKAPFPNDITLHSIRGRIFLLFLVATSYCFAVPWIKALSTVQATLSAWVATLNHYTGAVLHFLNSLPWITLLMRFSIMKASIKAHACNLQQLRNEVWGLQVQASLGYTVRLRGRGAGGAEKLERNGVTAHIVTAAHWAKGEDGLSPKVLGQNEQHSKS